MNGITVPCPDELVISVSEQTAPNWAGLLRRGVGVVLDKAVSVREFMTSVLGMDLHYATHSVPGLFLNNAPVDDWGDEIVGGGDEVGMSGTMPGLCGIALRRSSPIKAFRPDLVDRQALDKHAGIATVKMFNFVAQDCYRPVLAHGVVLTAAEVLQYLNDQGIVLQDCTCQLNEECLPAERIRGVLQDLPGDIKLVVRVEG